MPRRLVICTHAGTPVCEPCKHNRPHELIPEPWDCSEEDFCGEIREMVRCIPVEREGESR